MAGFSAADAALTGFAFVRERPKAVLLWAAVFLLIFFTFGVTVALVAGPTMVQLQAMRMQGVRDPAQTIAMMRRLVPLWLIFVPFWLGFHAVLYAAMNRAVLRPADERWGYLRLGMDEVRQFLLVLLIFVVAVASEIGFAIASAIPAIVIGLVVKPLAGVLMLIAFVATLAALIYFWVRLSLASALTFDSGRVNLFGSWPLTRDKVWPMLGCYVLAMALVLMAGVAILLIQLALGAMAGGGISGLQSFTQVGGGAMAAFTSPARLTVTVISAVIGAAAQACLYPVMFMPQAEIYRAISRATPT